MESNFKRRFNNFVIRDWINKDEGKLTYVQLFGFILIIIGIVYFTSFLLPNFVLEFFNKPSNLTLHSKSDEIPIAFFSIMLGVAFAFPDMLKGQTKDISTMRIIVFMFANVICMLLLKIGWDKPSLEAIGLNGYWMGVIAFLFGAKATQSYFENAGKLNNQPEQLKPIDDSHQSSNLGISEIAIAQLARVQNEANLQLRFSNILSISDTLSDGKACLSLYLRDNIKEDIPDFVKVELNKEKTLQVKTKVILNNKPATPHISQLKDEIVDSLPGSGIGSICCLIKRNNDFWIVTAGHNFTKASFNNLRGFQYGEDRRDVSLSGSIVGKLYYQRMDFVQDLALVLVQNKFDLSKDYTHFNSFYKVTQDDVKPFKNATIESRPNQAKRRFADKRDACIIDCNISYPVAYDGVDHYFKNVILIADSPEPNCKDVSVSGDSGSCVYLKDTDQLIGILIGGNGMYSIVLPIEEFVLNNNFKII